MRGYLVAHELPDRKVWVVDEFRATPAPAKEAQTVDDTMGDLQADLNLVRDAYHRFDLLDGRVRFLHGPVDTTLATSPIDTRRFAPAG